MYALRAYVNLKQMKKKQKLRNEKGKKNEIALLFSLVEFKIYKYITLWC